MFTTGLRYFCLRLASWWQLRTAFLHNQVYVFYCLVSLGLCLSYILITRILQPSFARQSQKLSLTSNGVHNGRTADLPLNGVAPIASVHSSFYLVPNPSFMPPSTPDALRLKLSPDCGHPTPVTRQASENSPPPKRTSAIRNAKRRLHRELCKSLERDVAEMEGECPAAVDVVDRQPHQNTTSPSPATPPAVKRCKPLKNSDIKTRRAHNIRKGKRASSKKTQVPEAQNSQAQMLEAQNSQVLTERPRSPTRPVSG